MAATITTDLALDLIRDRSIFTAHTEAASSLVSQLMARNLELHGMIALAEGFGADYNLTSFL